MSEPPPFPGAFMATHSDGAYRVPERPSRIFSVETEVDRDNAARAAYRASRAAEDRQMLPVRPDLAPRASRVQLIQDADGSTPTQAIPLMPHMRVEQRHTAPLAARPAEPPPLSADQQRHQMAMAQVNSAWRQRALEDAQDELRRLQTYCRYTRG